MRFNKTFCALLVICSTIPGLASASVILSSGVRADGNTIVRTVDAMRGLVCFTAVGYENSSTSCVKRQVKSAKASEVVGKIEGNQIKTLSDDVFGVSCVISSGYQQASISCL